MCCWAKIGYDVIPRPSGADPCEPVRFPSLRYRRHREDVRSEIVADSVPSGTGNCTQISRGKCCKVNSLSNSNGSSSPCNAQPYITPWRLRYIDQSTPSTALATPAPMAEHLSNTLYLGRGGATTFPSFHLFVPGGFAVFSAQWNITSTAPR